MVGIEKEKSKPRPYGQGQYKSEDIKPTLNGPHYKFTLLLPLTEKFEGEKSFRPVFTKEDLEKLIDLFNDDFGGATLFVSRGPPPLRGLWKDGDKVVINGNARIDVYAKLDNRSIDYFTELKARLLKYVDEVRSMRQEEMVIEINQDVGFVPKKTLDEIKAELEERLNNLKR